MNFKNLQILTYFVMYNLLFSCSSPKPPENMVKVNGGTLSTFIPYTDTPAKQPVIAFYIDKNLVSIADFKKFAAERKFITDAEKFGNSTIFDVKDQSWGMVDSANFLFPLGKKNRYQPDENHPATQISWQDAKYYCECQGKRLPTDAEWEFAAKSGKEDYNEMYAWGNDMKIGNKYKANYWQGDFPSNNTQEDGFLYTSPVGYFGANSIGISDMGGNVWQWCSDDIKPTPEEAKYDTASRKVLRGGSFLCDPKVCHGFRVIGRSSSTPETSSLHVGFRCVKDIK